MVCAFVARKNIRVFRNETQISMNADPREMTQFVAYFLNLQSILMPLLYDVLIRNRFLEMIHLPVYGFEHNVAVHSCISALLDNQASDADQSTHSNIVYDTTWAIKVKIHINVELI